MSNSVGIYDPDEEFDVAPVRPAWSIPKTPLEIEALRVCGRKYFLGKTKHDSEYAKFREHEDKALGSTDESYLYKKWIQNEIDWAAGINARQIKISFSLLLRMFDNAEKRTDWITRNRKRLLEERKTMLPDIDFSTFEV
jgi:hypothetical protein